MTIRFSCPLHPVWKADCKTRTSSTQQSDAFEWQHKDSYFLRTIYSTCMCTTACKVCSGLTNEAERDSLAAFSVSHPPGSSFHTTASTRFGTICNLNVCSFRMTGTCAVFHNTFSFCICCLISAFFCCSCPYPGCWTVKVMNVFPLPRKSERRSDTKEENETACCLNRGDFTIQEFVHMHAVISFCNVIMHIVN